MRLVPDLGLRIECKARVRWPVLGIELPVALNALTLMLVPSVGQGPHGDTLVFRIAIEHADFTAVPDIIDQRITKAINAKLESKDAELCWDLSKTLTLSARLPELSKRRCFARRTKWARSRHGRAVVYAARSTPVSTPGEDPGGAHDERRSRLTALHTPRPRGPSIIRQRARSPSPRRHVRPRRRRRPIRAAGHHAAWLVGQHRRRTPGERGQASGRTPGRGPGEGGASALFGGGTTRDLSTSHTCSRLIATIGCPPSRRAGTRARGGEHSRRVPSSTVKRLIATRGSRRGRAQPDACREGSLLWRGRSRTVSIGSLGTACVVARSWKGQRSKPRGSMGGADAGSRQRANPRCANQLPSLGNRVGAISRTAAATPTANKIPR